MKTNKCSVWGIWHAICSNLFTKQILNGQLWTEHVHTIHHKRKRNKLPTIYNQLIVNKRTNCIINELWMVLDDDSGKLSDKCQGLSM